MIQKKDLPQQTKRKGILALFWEGFLEGLNTPKEEQARQLSKNYKKEVQHLKMQEGQTVGAETVVPERESGWTRFVAGFKEGWNEEVAVEDYEDQTVHNNLWPIRDVVTGEILAHPFCYFPSFSIPDANDYTHPQYEDFWGNNSHIRK